MIDWIEAPQPSGTVSGFEWLGAPEEISACYPEVDVKKYQAVVAFGSLRPNWKTKGWAAQVFRRVGSGADERWSLVDSHGDIGSEAWKAYRKKYEYPGAVIYRWDPPLKADPARPPATGAVVIAASNVKLRDCAAPPPKDEPRDDTRQDDTSVDEEKKDEGIGPVGYVLGAAAVGVGLWLIFR